MSAKIIAKKKSIDLYVTNSSL